MSDAAAITISPTSSPAQARNPGRTDPGARLWRYISMRWPAISQEQTMIEPPTSLSTSASETEGAMSRNMASEYPDELEEASAMGMTPEERDRLARLEAQVEGIFKAIDALARTMSELNDNMRTLNESALILKGMGLLLLKTLAVVCAAVAFLAGGLTALEKLGMIGRH